MAIFYINPTYATNGDGTTKAEASGAGLAGAYNTWDGLTLTTGNSFLQLAGTTCNVANRIACFQANVSMDAYTASTDYSYAGSTRPKIISSAPEPNPYALHITNSAATGFTVKNLDISMDVAIVSDTTRDFVISPADPLLDMNLLAENCAFHRAGLNNIRIFGSGVTIRDCEIYDCNNDCIYGEASDITI